MVKSEARIHVQELKIFIRQNYKLTAARLAGCQGGADCPSGSQGEADSPE